MVWDNNLHHISQAAALEAVKLAVGNGDLDRGEQDLLMLYDYEAKLYTQSELANRYNISQQTISKRIKHAKCVLKRLGTRTPTTEKA